MSASEDSVVSDAPVSESSLNSHHAAQEQNLVPVLIRSSQNSVSAGHPEVALNIENDRESDASFLPESDDYELESEPPTNEQHDKEGLIDSNDPYAAEESYHVRPNRYHGPVSTWLSWTEDDRAVAESLDRERAENLSIHLYNAHVLRLEAKKLKQTRSRKPRRGSSETDNGEDAIFEPPKVWAAWPMPPQEVPRDSYSNSTADLRPSNDLEESLICATLKTARERWDARAWQAEKVLDDQRDSKLLLSSHEVEAMGTSPLNSTQSSPFVDKVESTEPDPPELMPRMQMFSSQAVLDTNVSSADESDNASEDDSYTTDQNARPVPLAADEKAYQLLIPSTRHVLSKLDSLLMGLHRARRAYTGHDLTAYDDCGMESTTDAEHSTASLSRRRRDQSKKRRASSAESGKSETSATLSSKKRTKSMRAGHSTPHQVQVARLGLRDWSDVLGIAALIGWDQNVVERASKRCADLFGENMLFRTFHEGVQEGEKSYFTEQLAIGGEPADSSGERGTEASTPEENVLQSLICPFETCRRHTNPFKQPQNLKQHLHQFHIQLQRPNVEDNKSSVKTGRHLCPIETCHRSRQQFSKGANLYLHIRRMHPEVNIEDFKKVEARRRGETRGKWTGEKRKRNPYER